MSEGTPDEAHATADPRQLAIDHVATDTSGRRVADVLVMDTATSLVPYLVPTAD